MKFLFDDESFSFEALRAAGYACYSGAELGEVLVTCRGIAEGDEDAWSRAWATTATRVAEIGRSAQAAGHRVSAREALLRASNYYRTADFYRREDPANDAESARLAWLSRDSFVAAAALFDRPPRPLRIPYQDTTLPGYLFLADDSGVPGPTVIYHGGYDSTLEEAYFALAAGALRRGYHVLAFDGPGQGTVRREQGLVFRPDWESVVTPVVDYALALPEVDAAKLVLVGTSLGGYLAARAAAFEHRIAAAVLHDGVYSFHEAVSATLPGPAVELMSQGRAEETEALMWKIAAGNTALRWALRNGKWTFGTQTAVELFQRTKPYTMAGIADRITCPTLVLAAENDQVFRGQPERIFDALRCEKQFAAFPEAEGGGEHCHEGAILHFHQVTFDWLDGVLAG